MAEEELILSGSGGGGGSSTEFTQTPDNLRSEDKFEGLLALGHGRWKGLTQGLRSLRLNDTPFTNGDTSNFPDWSAAFADGDPTKFPQKPTLVLGAGASPVAVNVTLANPTGTGTPVVRTVANTGADFIDLRFVVSQLYRQDKKGIFGHTATIRIRMKPSGHTNWIEVLVDTTASEPSYSDSGKTAPNVVYHAARNFYDASGARTASGSISGRLTITGKTTSPYVKEVRITVPNEGSYAGKGWDIECTLMERESVDADPNFEKRTILWESASAVYKDTNIGTDEEWTGLAWLGLLGPASDRISGIPEVWGEYDTKFVNAPPASVYNPDTRQYSGTVWDGSWVKAYTNDPAWVINDVLMDPLAGVSSIAPGSYLNKWDALELSKHCSELVSDGAAGTHPRFSMNAVFLEPQKADEFVRNIAGAVGAHAWDNGNGEWRCKVDKIETPVAIFTEENIESEFVYSHTDVDTRFNDITMVFKNAEFEYREDRVRVWDQPDIDANGRKPTSLVAIGCTNRQEALRRAMLRLRTSINEFRVVTFVTNRQGRFLEPLDTILVADKSLGYEAPSTTPDWNSITGFRAMTDTTITDLGIDATKQAPDGTMGVRKINITCVTPGAAFIRFNPAGGNIGGVMGTPTAGSVYFARVDGANDSVSFNVNDNGIVIAVDGTLRRFAHSFTHTTQNYGFWDMEGLQDGEYYVWAPQLVAQASSTSDPANTDTRDHTTGRLINRRRNLVQNSGFTGGTSGSPGTAPTGWTLPTISGLTRTVTFGTDADGSYMDVRFAGTVTAVNGNARIISQKINVTPGSQWTAAWDVQLIAGSTANIDALYLMIHEFTSAAAYLSSSATNITGGVSATKTRFTGTRTISASGGKIDTSIQFTQTLNDVLDFTLRLRNPQAEPGTVASAYIPTPVGSAADALELRDPLRLEPGATYKVKLTVPNPDYNPAPASEPTAANWDKPTVVIERDVAASSARGDVDIVHLTSTVPDDTPVYAPIALDATGLPTLPKTYRVIDIDENDDRERVSVTAVEVDTGKYAAADGVSASAISAQIPESTCPTPIAPAAGVLTVRQFSSDYNFNRVLEIDWERPASRFISGYEVSYSINDGPRTRLPETKDTRLEIPAPLFGFYSVYIVAVDRRGQRSLPLTATIEVTEAPPIFGYGADNILQPIEKMAVFQEFTRAVDERADIQAKADALTVSRVTYDAKFSALETYLNGLSPAYSDTSQSTTIVRTTWNQNWQEFYVARQNLLNAIDAKAATLADWSGVSGRPLTLEDLDPAAAAELDAASLAVDAAASDDILTAAEKQNSLAQSYARFETHYEQVYDQATLLGLSTTALTTARQNWLDLLASLVKGTKELLVNGDFSSSASWVLASATISGGTLNPSPTGAQGVADQLVTLVPGDKYEITYTITNYTSGAIRSSLYATAGFANGGAWRNALGTYTDIITCPASPIGFRFSSDAAGFTGSIDNVSLRKVSAWNDYTADTDIYTHWFADKNFPTGWPQNGTVTPTANGVYTTLTDNGAAVHETIYRSKAQTGVNQYSFGWRIKKDAVGKATRTVGVYLTTVGGASESYTSIFFDTATGEHQANNHIRPWDATGVLDLGDEWLLWGTTSTAAVNTEVQLIMYPAIGQNFTSSVATTGSVDVRAPQIVLGDWKKLGKAMLNARMAAFVKEIEALAVSIRQVRVITEWSVDGATLWHTNYTAGDLYMRQSNDNGVTWGPSVRVVGEDGVTPVVGLLTNETHAVAAASDGTGYSLTGAGGTFNVFSGTTDVTASSTFSIVGGVDGGATWTKAQNGLTLTINETTGVYSLSGAAWTSDTETFTLRAVYGSVTVDKTYTIAKSKTGATGSTGANAKLLTLNSTHQSFKYDATGKIVTQTTTITATRQNTSVATTFILRKPVAGTSHPITGYATQAGDVLTMTEAGFNQWIIDTGEAGVIVEAYVTDGGDIRDKVTLVKLNDGAPGTSNFTPAHKDGETRSPAPGVLEKFTGGTGWTGAGVYSSQGYVDGCSLSCKATATNRGLMIGLTDDPNGASANGYEHIDFAIYIADSGVVEAWYQGTGIAGLGAFAVGDRFMLEMNAGVVKLKKNGTVLWTYTQAASRTAPYYLDSAFYTEFAKIEEVSFVGTGSTGNKRSFVFKRSLLAPATPTGNGPVPTGWFDAPPADDGVTFLWQSNAELSASNVLIGVWSTPVRIDNISTNGWTPVHATANTTSPAPGRIKKAQSGAAYNHVYSVEGYVGGCTLSFTATNDLNRRLLGITTDPTAVDGTATIDYSISLNLTSGSFVIWENGVAKTTQASYAVNDDFQIAFAGGAVKYFHNGALIYTSLIVPSFTLPYYFDSAWLDPGTEASNISFVGTTAAIGGGNWTPIHKNANTISLGPGKVVKTGGTATWLDGGVYSAERYSGGCAVSCKAPATNTAAAIGLTSDPGALNFNHIDYAIYIGGTVPTVYENGVSKGDFGTYVAGDRFQIAIRDGVVRYSKNNVVFYTSLVVPSTSTPYALDIEFYNKDKILEEITFIGTGMTGLRPDVKFIRQNATPATPTGNNPAGWSDGVPGGTETLWQTRGNKNGADNLVGTWSPPQAISALTNRGTWSDASVIYYVNNFVTYNGGTYVCTVQHTSSTTIKPSGTDQANGYWDVLAAPGTDAPSGSGDLGTSGARTSIDVPASTSGQNLRSLADAAGYAGGNAYIDFVTTGNVTGSPGLVGIDTGTWPHSTKTISLKLTVASTHVVRGGGGEGGGGGFGTGDGGDGMSGGAAINCQVGLDQGIINNGTVQGGGGGGGGGGGFRGGGGLDTLYEMGGGGGGGFPNGLAGNGDPVGAAGTTSGGGTGGDNIGTAGDGGAGGGAAVSGSSGTGATGNGGMGGADGYAVRKNGFVAAVSGTGTTTGTVG